MGRTRTLLLAAVVVSGCSSGNAPGGVGSGGGPPGMAGIPSTGEPGVTNNGLSCQGLMAQPLDSTWTVSSGGVDRTFDVHVPQSYDPTKPTPLVMNFHGYTSNSMQEALLSLMNDKSDKAGFIVVYPQGTGSTPSWNAGACCGDAATNNTDDVGFVNTMLDKLETDLCIDSKRIYSTGMSNGGFLSHRLGCELADRIAAVAPVAGVLGISTCAPSRPMPIIHFHGTADPLVPYNGNASMNFPSVPDTFSGWAMRDGCTDSAPATTFMMGDSSCATYQQCKGGVEVTLCTVQNGGHTWPGGTPVPSLGYTTTNLSATDAMWDFFVKHPMN